LIRIKEGERAAAYQEPKAFRHTSGNLPTSSTFPPARLAADEAISEC
jgi:hypothetical protein